MSLLEFISFFYNLCWYLSKRILRLDHFCAGFYNLSIGNLG